MNFIRNKLILYMVIIASGLDYTLPWPIFQIKIKTKEQELLPANTTETRFTRQVVQPTWLNFGREPLIDPKVHVNPESLFEAAEIRKTIQKAVEEDTFAVIDGQQDKNNDMVKFFNIPSTGETNATHAINGLPNWYVHMQTLWRNWTHGLFKGFGN